MKYQEWISENSTPIFLFHGVITKHKAPLRNFLRKHIDQDQFRSFLTTLLQKGTPLTLDECLDSKGQFKPKVKNGFVITFDDGFKNNLKVAAPILEEFKVPALFYLTTQFVDSNTRSWIDIIESAIQVTPSVQLHMPFEFLNVKVTTIPEKQQLLTNIRKVVKNDATIDPYEFADTILNQLSMKDCPWDAELDDKLNWDDVKELAKNPLFTIGGHSHTHRILSFLDDKQLTEELDTSLCLIRKHTGIEIRHYCYPDGLSNCYSPNVITQLKKRNILASPTAIEGTNQAGDDPFHLKRIMVV